MYQIRCELPAGTRSVEARLEYVTAAAAGGRASPAVASAQLMVLQVESRGALPAGRRPRSYPFAASVQLPGGVVLRHRPAARSKDRPTAPASRPVSLETLIDSPLAAGATTAAWISARAGPAPHPAPLRGQPGGAGPRKTAPCRRFRRLVAEAGSLFGGWPYPVTSSCSALSDHIPHGGLEHHESSDNRVWERTLDRRGQIRQPRAGLLPARDGAQLERQAPPPGRPRHRRLPAADEDRAALGLRGAHHLPRR